MPNKVEIMYVNGYYTTNIVDNKLPKPIIGALRADDLLVQSIVQIARRIFHTNMNSVVSSVHEIEPCCGDADDTLYMSKHVLDTVEPAACDPPNYPTSETFLRSVDMRTVGRPCECTCGTKERERKAISKHSDRIQKYHFFRG